MMFTISKSISAVIASVSLFTAVVMAGPAARADDKDIAQALRAGGLVLVVRHGATFPDKADTDPLNFDNIAAQRNLNDKGKALAKAFGEALRQAGVPVGKVYTSKYNRAFETAVIAGFPDIEKTTDLTEGGLIVSPNENNRRADAFRKMLAAAPKDHTNTILITHQPNIVAALGKDCSTSRKARRRSSVPPMAATSSLPASRWTSGRASQPSRRSSAERHS
jgi:phosphohistidine phosphatase SixA